jgi:D-alanyl-D-alanine carboxypeptidase/D-alanyl-D-alanine-endopeptidase (penicillin-binding protein 4)
MGIGQFIRRWALPVGLGAMSLVAWQAAEREDTDTASFAPIDYAQTLETPMLSPRRIPLTLRVPVIDDRVRPQLEVLISGSPPDSCLMVETDGRLLRPTSKPDTPLVPASNQKVVTTFVALEVLEPDFRYETRVEAPVAPAGGVIDADVYLIGSGDPFLSTDAWWEQYEITDARYHTRLEDLADDVVDAGITTITGRLVGDESLFDAIRLGPWADRLIAGNQSGPLSALTVNEGFVDWPAVYPDSARLRSPTDNPPLHAASVLAQLLQERGVTIAGGVAAGEAPDPTITVASVQSPPLTDVVTHINSYSSNLGAELLLKRIGLNRGGAGSTEAGAAVVLDVLAEKGIPTEGLVIEDGSGLAESGRLSCQALTAILADAGPESALARSLAIGAERGSLLNRFVDTAAAGSVYAKTGTLNNVIALSGFVRSASEPDTFVTFAHLANEEFIIANEAIPALEDAFVVAMTDYPSGPTVDLLSPLEPSTP